MSSAPSPVTTPSSSSARPPTAARKCRPAWPASPGSKRNKGVSVGARVVLAYSGGLDTSVAVRWMGEQWGCEVIALAVDVGQGGDFETIRKRALSAGAVEAEVVDARARYASECVVPDGPANASYAGRDPHVQ